MSNAEPEINAPVYLDPDLGWVRNGRSLAHDFGDPQPLMDAVNNPKLWAIVNDASLADSNPKRWAGAVEAIDQAQARVSRYQDAVMSCDALVQAPDYNPLAVNHTAELAHAYEFYLWTLHFPDRKAQADALANLRYIQNEIKIDSRILTVTAYGSDGGTDRVTITHGTEELFSTTSYNQDELLKFLSSRYWRPEVWIGIEDDVRYEYSKLEWLAAFR